VTQNRVSATGDIVDSPLRGAWMGNRGVVHREHSIVRPWGTRRWITCALEFRGWRAPMWVEGRWTALFFHDEAVALGAGHRPCALCRRPAYRAFIDAWGRARGERLAADAMDLVLHADRVDGRRQRVHGRPWPDLPDGVFVAHDGAPAVVVGDRVVAWDPASGYGAASARPRSGTATVLTPAVTVAVIAGGYAPEINAAASSLTRSR
jgi:hypothetical protein